MNHRNLTGRRSAEFAIPGAKAHYPPDLELEPSHLDITLTFDVPARTAAGKVVTTVGANRAGARRLRLSARSFEDLQVADGEGRPLTWRYDGREIDVRWEESFAAGESRPLAISYRVVRPLAGLYFSVPDEDYPERAHWVATDHETERARYWLPCVDLPAVRTTLAFHLTASEDYTILANGLLESEETAGEGTKTAHWRLDWPCPSYLVCMAIGEFERYDDEEVDGRPIAYFGARGRVTPEDLRRSFGRTPEFIRWFEQKLAVPFPFPKYYQFALPQIGGAMENISLVSWDDLYATDERFHREVGDLVDIVNVHEMAHSYFGDAVVIRDFAHAWLKESWAVYMEACWREDVQGDDEFRYNLFQNARAYMEESEKSYVRPIVTRVFHQSWDMYDRHLYPGGSWRVHMLRRLLGDEVFWPAVTDYLTTFSGRTVETDDFRKVLEAHSGRSLVEFFDQWLIGKGYPKLKATFKHDADRGEGVLTVEQTQVPEKPAAGETVEPFRFPLTIEFAGPGGETTRRTVDVRERKQAFVQRMAGPPKAIRLDPDGSVLFSLEFNPGDDILRAALTDSADAVGRILAGEELLRTGRHPAFETVRSALASESFWGVRHALAKALGESRSALAIPVLSERLAEETDPRVLLVLATRAGAYRDERIAAALLALIERDPTYRVKAAALRSLGAQRGEAHLELLREAAEDVGFRGLVRAGALGGLAETRTRAAFELLAARQGYGRETDDAAPHAAEALAANARFQDRPRREAAAELLRDLLRDGRDRVRMAAARALGALGDMSAPAAIEAILPAVPDESHTALKRIMSGIRAAAEGEPEAAKLTKELERLEDRYRKLEERVDRLEQA